MAPTEKTDKADKATAFSDKETLVLALSWQCFKTQPDIDVDKLAALAGYSNPRSVQNLLSVIRKKIANLAPNSGANGGDAPTAPVGKKTKATPRKRKPASDGDDGGDAPTPPKRVRAKKAVLPKPVDDGEDDSEPDKKALKKDEGADEFAEV
ncbi:hypothetical protein F4821DRAFT_238267 [Hypoxylon rubiginosum]|uniref:Uncharacterized protein n=1 Tax=Hypoxylon rubiginosum TaxID=110542 RepID=A0ACC0D140_9PEZI|nr:hypothetical protein F4821DRAFT_238267 [Hypoxylon rubiginosum]